MTTRIKRRCRLASLLFLFSHALSCAGQPATDKSPAAVASPLASPLFGNREHGIASVYTDHRTASGERFSTRALTAAHRTLPFGSRVVVTSPRTGRSVIVRINDRGPYAKGRVIDLTPAAAAALGLTKKMGITKVAISRMR